MGQIAAESHGDADFALSFPLLSPKALFLMISRKTVMVLGAGASAAYGFPLGSQLLARCRNLWSEGGTPEKFARLAPTCDVSLESLHAFARALHLSGVNSVDTFLSRRPDLVDAGKLAIAYFISEFEDSAQLCRVDNDDDWLAFVWNRMLGDAKDLHEVDRRNLRFVTFNYDRSLEARIFDFAANTFPNVTADRAQQFVDGFEICHVYGATGRFHYAGANGCQPFGPTGDGPSLLARAAGLKIIPEARHDDAVFREIRNSFAWAEDICFMGFGFDRLNLERLNLPSVRRSQIAKGEQVATVWASTSGLTNVERNEAQALTALETWNSYDFTNLKFLRNVTLLR